MQTPVGTRPGHLGHGPCDARLDMAAPKLSTFKCPNCSAPLQIPPHETDIRCHYCGNPVHVERTKAPTMAMGPRPTNTVYLDPNAGKAVGWIIALSVGLPILIPLVIGLIALVGTAVHGRVMSLPTTCDANDSITISGKTFNGTGPVVVAGVNCKITIKDSHLKSDVVVKGGQNLELTIVNSTLEGSVAAIDLADVNSKLDISGKSEIKGKEGIRGGLNVEIHVKDSKITGEENGIVTKQNLKLIGTNVEISGTTAGIDGGNGADIELHQSKVTSPGVAVTGGINLDIDAEATTLDGGDTTVKGGVNLKLKLSKKSQVTSKKGTPVEGDTNLEITMDDSTIDGADTAVHGASNFHLTATKKSRVHANGTVLETETNPELVLDDSSVEGGDIGLEARLNAKVKVVKGARIYGNKIAIDAHQNMEIDLQGGTIESKGVAVQATFNSEVRAKKGTIKGGTAAFSFERRPNTFEVADTTITGPQKMGAN